MKISQILWYYGLLQEKGKRIPEVLKKKSKNKNENSANRKERKKKIPRKIGKKKKDRRTSKENHVGFPIHYKFYKRT